MKNLLLGVVLVLALAACTDKRESAPEPVTGDIAAGKVIAERDCKACHGANGGGVAPGIPHLAAQRERYLLASLKEYKEGKRAHAALKDMATKMSEATCATWPRTSPACRRSPIPRRKTSNIHLPTNWARNWPLLVRLSWRRR